jgi:hypothetical protein
MKSGSARIHPSKPTDANEPFDPEPHSLDRAFLRLSDRRTPEVKKPNIKRKHKKRHINLRPLSANLRISDHLQV